MRFGTRTLGLGVGIATIALAVSACTSTPSTGAGEPSVAPTSSASGTVTVFAAASLTESFAAIADAFEKANPEVTVVLNFGGSSGLAEQIVQGAPADVFAAANSVTMARVVDAELASAPTDFATNSLELVVPAGNPGGVTGLADLADPQLAIALCAVEVPCGAASAQVLAAAGVTASVDTYEQDVKAVLTKVQLGEVDAGLVYRTDVLAAGTAVEGIEFDGAADAAAPYPIATITAAANADAAGAFVAFVLSAAGQGILAAAGFGAP